MPVRRAVITGASTGIGRACALRLDSAGWIVYAGVLTPEEGDDLRLSASDRLVPLVLDVTDDAAISAAVERVTSEVQGDGISGLVNNAGIAVASPLELVPISELRRQFDVSLIGAIATTQAFLPLLRVGGGRIVNIGSAWGSIALPFLGPYTAAKAALERVSDTLRLELHPWGISVSLIAPARVKTAIWADSFAMAVKLSRRMSSEGRKLYDWPASVTAFGNFGSATTEVPVDAVVDAVVHALTSRRPRRLYPVSVSGRIARAIPRLTAGGLRDWVGLKASGFKSRTRTR